jgi:hypothetical protein
MSCRTNIQDLKLNSGLKFKDATPDQIVAEMEEWWKIESFRIAALAMVATEMKVIIEKDMAERHKRGGTRRIPVRPVPLAF